jgi:hypothetical protein
MAVFYHFCFLNEVLAKGCFLSFKQIGQQTLSALWQNSGDEA